MLRVLIVDDQAAIIATLSYVLRKIASVVQSESLVHAQNALIREKFDLAIFYLRISDSGKHEGLELVRFVRTTHPETKVIILAGPCNEAVRKEAYELGAMHFYEKPLDISHLISQVQSLMR